jgi:TPR repeat protein
MAAYLALSSLLRDQEARGAVALKFAEDIGNATPRWDCEQVRKVIQKYVRYRTITKERYEALIKELGECDCPPYEDANGHQYCWRCSRNCPEFQELDAACGCLFMDSQWRVTGYGIPQCKPSAAALDLRNRAMRGDADAQYDLGDNYRWGSGAVPRDLRKAAEWFRMAANQGHARSQYQLGKCYEEGEGVEKDRTKAIEWYRKAAARGDSDAKGVLRRLGELTDLEFYKEKAEKGDAEAQNTLGTMYAKGDGVTQSDSEALYWYWKAAERGNAPAQYNLGLAYRDGKGVNKNDGEARKWLKKAADQGHEDAKKKLAEISTSGDVWSSLKAAWQKLTQKEDDQAASTPLAPDPDTDRKHPAKTSSDVCPSAQLLLNRIEEGIVVDEKDGRISMGNSKEVTNGQEICSQWQKDMKKYALDARFGGRINDLGDAIRLVDHDVRLVIKYRNEMKLTGKTDYCWSISEQIKKFNDQVKFIDAERGKGVKSALDSNRPEHRKESGEADRTWAQWQTCRLCVGG